MSIKSNVMKTNEGSEKSEKNSILSVSIMGARDETLRLSECGFESMDDEAGLLPEGMKVGEVFNVSAGVTRACAPVADAIGGEAVVMVVKPPGEALYGNVTLVIPAVMLMLQNAQGKVVLRAVRAEAMVKLAAAVAADRARADVAIARKSRLARGCRRRRCYGRRRATGWRRGVWRCHRLG